MKKLKAWLTSRLRHTGTVVEKIEIEGNVIFKQNHN